MRRTALGSGPAPACTRTWPAHQRPSSAWPWVHLPWQVPAVARDPPIMSGTSRHVKVRLTMWNTGEAAAHNVGPEGPAAGRWGPRGGDLDHADGQGCV